MRHLLTLLALVTATLTATAQEATVYLTRDISPTGLLAIYHALGREATGRVAVKISTGEAGNPNYLRPELIAPLVREVGGTIVECNTAYGGRRNTTEAHRQTARDHGFTAIAAVDIMDAEGSAALPVRDTTHIKRDLVGSHLLTYDFLINLAHFKGHPMGGLGGALKNQSIGCASAAGKAYIHSAGRTDDPAKCWNPRTPQDDFLRSMASAAQAVADRFGDRIIYINVMNNMSVDCDCVAHPKAVEMRDYGILASTDPVALDQACVDIVFGMQDTPGNRASALKERISSRHGTLIIDHAERIGLGTKRYKLVSIDKKKAAR